MGERGERECCVFGRPRPETREQRDEQQVLGEADQESQSGTDGDNDPFIGLEGWPQQAFEIGLASWRGFSPGPSAEH